MVKLSFTALVLLSSSLVSAHSHPDSSSHQIRNLADDESQVRKLRIRHPLVNAKVNGKDPALQPRSVPQSTLVARKAQQAAASVSASGAGSVAGASSAIPPLTFTASGINTAGVLALGSTTTPEVTSALPTTYPAGAQPPISNAPKLPAINIVPANYPTLDKAPPLGTPQVNQWLSQIDLTTVPNIPVNQLGGCANASNAAATAAAATNGWWTCGGYTRSTDVTQCPTKNTWGVTYDDGPSPDTPRLLNFLDGMKTKVTFFVVGSRVISRPDILQYEYMDGHQICVHTWSHTALTTQSNEEIVAELGWSKYAIQQVLGVTPNCMRPPYGDIDDRVRSISQKMGLQPVIWTRANGITFDSQDWQIGAGVPPTTVCNNFNTIFTTANSLSTGFIVLEHDLYQQSVNIALNCAWPLAHDISPALSFNNVIGCLGKQPGDSYMETATNSSFTTAGSSGSGTVPGATTPSASATAATTSSKSGSMKLSSNLSNLVLVLLGLGGLVTLML